MLALLPAAAHAGTASVENGRIAYLAATGEKNDVTITPTADSASTVLITDTSSPVTPGEGCIANSAGGASCPGAGAALILVQLGDGDDSVTINDARPAQVTGSTGNDVLRGGPGDDILRGEEGDDQLFGNEGNDSLIAASGNDTLDGGAGDDSLQSGTGDDSLTGGTGNDTLTAGDGKDALAGGDGNDRLEAGKGADALDGGEGNDVLLTAEGEFKGTLERRIACGPGDDTLTAGPADPFVSDCERTDGASLRLQRDRSIPLLLVCTQACKGTVRIRDAKNKINASAPFKLAAGKLAHLKLKLTAAQTAGLFKNKKVRLTARFDLTSGGAPQQVRATFTLLRLV